MVFLGVILPMYHPVSSRMLTKLAATSTSLIFIISATWLVSKKFDDHVEAKHQTVIDYTPLGSIRNYPEERLNLDYIPEISDHQNHPGRKKSFALKNGKNGRENNKQAEYGHNKINAKFDHDKTTNLITPQSQITTISPQTDPIASILKTR